MPAWILMAASSWVKAYKSTQHSQGEGPKHHRQHPGIPATTAGGRCSHVCVLLAAVANQLALDNLNQWCLNQPDLDGAWSSIACWPWTTVRT